MIGAMNSGTACIRTTAVTRPASVPMVKVMEWNRTKRFGRAYLDGGSLYVQMDMDVERGATTEALANNLERWAAVVDQFPKFFQ